MIVKLFLSLIFLCFSATSVSASEVHLLSGESIEGEIIEYNEHHVKINVGGEEKTYTSNEINYITVVDDENDHAKGKNEIKETGQNRASENAGQSKRLPEEQQANLDQLSDQTNTSSGDPFDAFDACDNALLEESIAECALYQCKKASGFGEMAWMVNGFLDNGRCHVEIDVKRDTAKGTVRSNCEFTESTRRKYAESVRSMFGNLERWSSECQDRELWLKPDDIGVTELKQAIIEKAKSKKGGQLPENAKLKLEEIKSDDIEKVFVGEAYQHLFYVIKDPNNSARRSYIPSLEGRVILKNRKEIISIKMPTTNEKYERLEEFINPEFHITGEATLRTFINAVNDLYGYRPEFFEFKKVDNKFIVYTEDFMSSGKSGFEVYVNDLNQVESVHQLISDHKEIEMLFSGEKSDVSTPEENQEKINKAFDILTTAPSDAVDTCAGGALKQAINECSSFQCEKPHPFFPGAMTMQYVVDGFTSDGHCKVDINQDTPQGLFSTKCQFTESTRKSYAELVDNMEQDSGDWASECEGSIGGQPVEF